MAAFLTLNVSVPRLTIPDARRPGTSGCEVPGSAWVCRARMRKYSRSAQARTQGLHREVHYVAIDFSASARSVRSQGNSRSSRPKWPYAAVCW